MLAILLELFFANSNNGSSTTKVVVSNVVCVPDTVKFPVIVVLAFSAISPDPLGSNVISAFDGEIIVEPVNVKSPTDTVPNVTAPEPSVCNTCPALPSDDGRVYAPFILTFPDPLGLSVKSALLGGVIVDPTIVKSPKDKSANDNVPEPSVLRNCPVDPSDDWSVYAPLMFTFPDPLGSNIKSALLGVVIVDPTIVRSPNDTSAKDSVPEPSVFKN